MARSDKPVDPNKPKRVINRRPAETYGAFLVKDAQGNPVDNPQVEVLAISGKGTTVGDVHRKHKGTPGSAFAEIAMPTSSKGEPNQA